MLEKTDLLSLQMKTPTRFLVRVGARACSDGDGSAGGKAATTGKAATGNITRLFRLVNRLCHLKLSSVTDLLRIGRAAS